MPKQMSFAVAMKDFFGLKEGQNSSGFMQEIKALDAADRAYFKAGLEQNGYEIMNFAPQAAA